MKTEELCWESIRTHTFKALDWLCLNPLHAQGPAQFWGSGRGRRICQEIWKLGVQSQSGSHLSLRKRGLPDPGNVGPLNFTNSQVYPYPLAWEVWLPSAHSSLGPDPGWYPSGLEERLFLKICLGKLYLPGNRGHTQITITLEIKKKIICNDVDSLEGRVGDMVPESECSKLY